MRNLPAVFLLGVLIGSPVLARDCETIEGNVVPGCGFESPAEVGTWSTEDGIILDYAPNLGETGDAGVGTPEDFGGVWVFSTKSACFAAGPGQEFDLGYWVQWLNGSVPERCTAGWQQWADDACTVGNGGSAGRDEFVPGANYIEVKGSHLVGAGTVKMSLTLDCRSTVGAFEVLVDNAYAKVSIFADGFESGDTSAWSNTVP